MYCLGILSDIVYQCLLCIYIQDTLYACKSYPLFHPSMFHLQVEAFLCIANLKVRKLLLSTGCVFGKLTVTVCVYRKEQYQNFGFLAG